MVKYSCNWNPRRGKKREQDKTNNGQEFSELATDPPNPHIPEAQAQRMPSSINTNTRPKVYHIRTAKDQRQRENLEGSQPEKKDTLPTEKLRRE